MAKANGDSKNSKRVELINYFELHKLSRDLMLCFCEVIGCDHLEDIIAGHEFVAESERTGGFEVLHVGLAAEVDSEAVPAITGVLDLLSNGDSSVAGGTRRNRQYAETFATFAPEVSEVRRFPLDALPPDLAFEHDRRVLADWKRAVQAGRINTEMRQRVDGSN